jgi:hypothetical protein
VVTSGVFSSVLRAMLALNPFSLLSSVLLVLSLFGA